MTLHTSCALQALAVLYCDLDTALAFAIEPNIEYKYRHPALQVPTLHMGLKQLLTIKCASVSA
jgi:hypothetical protein